MFKRYARKTEGSCHVSAEGFGDHVVADFVLIWRPVEQGIDGQNFMLVIKDIYSQYRCDIQLKAGNMKKLSKEYLIFSS